MHQEDVEKFYRNLFNNCDSAKWQLFSEEVRSNYSAEDNHKLIEFTIFVDLVEKHLGHKINDKMKK